MKKNNPEKRKMNNAIRGALLVPVEVVMEGCI
jgi:hypothetical protein